MPDLAAPPLPSPREFAGRAARFAAFGLGGLALSLGLGMIGYRYVAGFGWIDSFFNASMILSGMGPADPMPDAASKLFAGTYAILAGLAWTGLTGVILFPFIQRMLHALHLQMRGQGGDE